MDELKKYSKELTILAEVDELKKKVDENRPFEKSIEDRVLQKLRFDWNYNSNAIEGNSFTRGETVALLMEGVTAQGKPLKDALDIRGHNQAIEMMMSIVKSDRDLNESDIRTLHKILLVEDYESPAVTEDGLKTLKLIKVGQYKSSPNHVITPTGETHFYATPEETPAKMKELVEWYNQTTKNNEIHPIVFASVFHHKFVEIHPFDDGNGRMARLLTNLILIKNKYPISVVKTNEKTQYFGRLAQADDGNYVPIIEFFALSINSSLNLYLKAIKGESISEPTDIERDIELFMQSLNLTKKRILLRETVDITKMSFDLLVFFRSKLVLFNDAFQNKSELLRSNYGASNAGHGAGRWSSIVNNHLISFEIYKKHIEQHITKTYSISYVYTYKNDLKSNSTISTEVGISFLNKTYKIRFENKTITKYYGDELIDQEVIEIAKNMIDLLKIQLSRIYNE
ncbi:Fic family protein [Psychroserpens sp.]|uniref:Fic family protein n=1 Tax=Psychroserpens sp. TaxID=2020870 RepID=UPI001B11A31C|nr:Fic family protein [Psychroserpens sp.]MBO6605318.1 Fic family protein [Psychroserpens sp.]MBO6629999.1 Fic family protein [Psychroserpens sp.]MBO6653873.1 Fic family protein [Psychroserpens sp.]MBO6682194.1 Fic family protein [Psychroserpens sp.]MBO6748692.1 Fic family protein [Psychroserpens sp.]